MRCIAEFAIRLAPPLSFRSLAMLRERERKRDVSVLNGDLLLAEPKTSSPLCTRRDVCVCAAFYVRSSCPRNFGFSCADGPNVFAAGCNNRQICALAVWGNGAWLPDKVNRFFLLFLILLMVSGHNIKIMTRGLKYLSCLEQRTMSWVYIPFS